MFRNKILMFMHTNIQKRKKPKEPRELDFLKEVQVVRDLLVAREKIELME